MLVYTVVSLVSLVPRGDREPLRCRMLMRETCDLCCLAMRIAASFLLILVMRVMLVMWSGDEDERDNEKDDDDEDEVRGARGVANGNERNWRWWW